MNKNVTHSTVLANLVSITKYMKTFSSSIQVDIYNWTKAVIFIYFVYMMTKITNHKICGEI